MGAAAGDGAGGGDNARPSKSARKRAALAAQDLGEALVRLPAAELDALALPEVLKDALLAARRITARAALARQRQYIGKLMRGIDLGPIRAALAARSARATRATARFPGAVSRSAGVVRYNAPLSAASPKPLVGIIMGSASDWETLERAADMLDQLAVPYEVRVVSAHRTPDLLFEYAAGARARGLEVLIAGAGGAAHLPGMAAAKTTLPVLGVPVASKSLGGLDSLLSIVQMPAGVPVATFAIGAAGAGNAALCAAAILGNKYPAIAAALEAFRERQTAAVLGQGDPRTRTRA